MPAQVWQRLLDWRFAIRWTQRSMRRLFLRSSSNNANRKQQLLVEGGDSCLLLVAQLSQGLDPHGSRGRRYTRSLFAPRSIRRRVSCQLASASRFVRLFVCWPALLDLL